MLLDTDMYVVTTVNPWSFFLNSVSTKSVVHWVIGFMAKPADEKCSHRAEVEIEMFSLNLKSKIHRQWVLFVSVRLKQCQNTYVQTIQKFFDFGDVWEEIFSWTLAPVIVISYVDKMKVMFLFSQKKNDLAPTTYHMLGQEK